MWVAVDAMSGDFGPAGLVEGSVDAVNQFGYSVVLVGDEEILSEELLKYEYDTSKIRVVHAPDVIGMNDSPSVAVRSMPDSSIVQSVKLVADREAFRIVSKLILNK